MSENDDGQEEHTVIRREIETYFSNILPHDSIIAGYQKAIPDGGKEVITIVKRQQIFTFIYNMFSLFTNNFIPVVLILPILFAISAGAIIEVTVISSIPMGLFTAGSAIGRVVTTWRGSGAEDSTQLPGSSTPPEQPQLPPNSTG